MRIECCRFGRMDFHFTWYALAIDVDHSTSIFKLFTAVRAYKFAAFFSVFPSPSSPSVSTVSARNDREKKRNGSYAPARLF